MMQKRFRHLNEEQIEHIQKQADTTYERLNRLVEMTQPKQTEQAASAAAQK